MSCYSDHNEDIRTKGSCDMCGGTEPEGARLIDLADYPIMQRVHPQTGEPIGDPVDLRKSPRWGVVSSSELGDNWSAEHHLAKQLPGDQPEEIGPSGVYGFRRVDPMSWETEGPVVQVVEATNGRQWIATPARHYASQIAQTPAPLALAIDQGMGWYLPKEDVEAWVAFARRVLAEQ